MSNINIISIDKEAGPEGLASDSIYRNDNMYNIFKDGRWYRFFIESDGTTAKLTHSDIKDAEIAANYLKLPAEYHILDRKYDINFTGAASITEVIKSYASGNESVPLPTVSGYDYGYVYIFAHKKGRR